MKSGKILFKNSGTVFLSDVSLTSNALERMRGLLFRPQLKAGQALLIRPCSSIHMFGMRYALDILYLDKEFKVMKIVESIQPNRMSMCKGADMVIEMPTGTLANSEITISSELLWEENK